MIFSVGTDVLRPFPTIPSNNRVSENFFDGMTKPKPTQLSGYATKGRLYGLSIAPRQSDPAPQVGETGIVADVVKRRPNVEVDQRTGAILISRFEEPKGLVFLPQNAPALR
jgi:hypothetical protein